MDLCKQDGIFIPTEEVELEEFDPIVYMPCFDEKIHVANVRCEGEGGDCESWNNAWIQNYTIEQQPTIGEFIEYRIFAWFGGNCPVKDVTIEDVLTGQTWEISNWQNEKTFSRFISHGVNADDLDRGYVELVLNVDATVNGEPVHIEDTLTIEISPFEPNPLQIGVFTSPYAEEFDWVAGTEIELCGEITNDQAIPLSNTVMTINGQSVSMGDIGVYEIAEACTPYTLTQADVDRPIPDTSCTGYFEVTVTVTGNYNGYIVSGTATGIVQQPCET